MKIDITKYRRFSIGIMLLLIFLLSACEEQIDWDLQTRENNTVVVDAILTNEFRYQEIRLSRLFSEQNESPEFIVGAFVRVETNSAFMDFIESPDDPGLYLSPQPVSASISETYSLSIEYDGREYSAETYMIPVLPAQAPLWIYHEDKNLFSIQWPEGNYNPVQQAMFEAIITWDHLVEPGTSDTLTHARLMYYSFNTIDVSYTIFPQDKEEVYFPENSIALVKKYALTDEFAAYLRALLAETEWQGSLFEDARGNLPGNITNGGIGYFGACSVISDTLIVN